MLRITMTMALLLVGCGEDDEAAPGGGGSVASGGAEGGAAGEGGGGQEGQGEEGGGQERGGAGEGGAGEGGGGEGGGNEGGGNEGGGDEGGTPEPFGCESPVVINEVLYDPLGNEGGGMAFVEIHGEAGGDLTGWELVRLQRNGTRDGEAIVLSGTIPASGYLVVGESATVQGGVTADLVDSNVDGEATANAFELYCSSVLVDSMAYGEWEGAPPGEGGAAAAVSEEGHSLSRCPDGADTTNNVVDFRSSPATPGAVNDQCPAAPPSCGEDTPGPALGDLVINEVGVQPVTVGAKTFPEFIEVVNASGHALDMSHHRVRWNPLAEGAFNTDLPLSAGACLLTDQVLLVWGGDGANPPNSPDVVLVSYDRPQIRNDEGEVQVVTQGGEVLASLCYGKDGCGFDPVTATVALDPDLNTSDPAAPHDVAWFSRGKQASPGTCQNGDSFASGCESLAGGAVCAAAAATGVVINEVGFAPADDGPEYVELYNAGVGAADLSGYTVSDGVGIKHTFAEGTTLPAGKALVLLKIAACPEESPFEDGVVFACTSSLGLNNDGDIVVLAGPDGTVDEVGYGPGVSEPPCKRRSMAGVAFARHPDGGATWAPHTLHPDRRVDSLGLRLDRTPF